MEAWLGAGILAITASVGYGLSDVPSGVVVRRHTVASVALWAQLMGVVVLTAAILVRRPGASPPGILWGATGGVLGALAVLAFYTALQNGPTALVAPIAGSGVLVPLAVGLARGEMVGALGVVGLVGTVAGVLVVATAGERGDVHRPDGWRARRPTVSTPGRAQPVPVHDGCRPYEFRHRDRAAVLLSVVAAIGFGTFFVVLDQATAAGPPDGGVLDGVLAVALAVQVGTLLVTVTAATRHSLVCLRPDRSLILVAGPVGVLDVVSDLVLTSAVGVGPLAVVGPLGSLDPVVSVLVATVLLRERIGRAQALGVVLTLAGTALVSF